MVGLGCARFHGGILGVDHRGPAAFHSHSRSRRYGGPEGQPEAPTSSVYVPAATTSVAPAAYTGAASHNKPVVALLGGVVALIALA